MRTVLSIPWRATPAMLADSSSTVLAATIFLDTDCRIIETGTSGSFLLGVYLPLQYKLGFEKTKHVITVLLLVTPYVLPHIGDWLSSIKLDFSFVEGLTNNFRLFLCLLTSIFINVTSILFSIRFYNKKEL